MPERSLGDRMRGYENSYRLEPKMPVIGRIDGKNFSRLTKSMSRPFDLNFQKIMMLAAIYVAENMQGCQMAYTQSDEINILLTDYENENTQGAFNYRLEKLCSVAASLATGSFLASMMNYFPDYRSNLQNNKGLPAFDARFFSLPKNEVVNYFIFRQQDGIRNSIQMLARHHFSHTECEGKNSQELKEMLNAVGVDWHELPTCTQRGTVLLRKSSKETIVVDKEGQKEYKIVEKRKWGRDLEIPLFWEDRDYIQRFV